VGAAEEISKEEGAIPLRSSSTVVVGCVLGSVDSRYYFIITYVSG